GSGFAVKPLPTMQPVGGVSLHERGELQAMAAGNRLDRCGGLAGLFGDLQFETNLISIHVTLGVGSGVQLLGVTSRMGLRRPPPPDPTRHPTGSPHLLLLRLLPRLLPLQVQGAALLTTPLVHNEADPAWTPSRCRASRIQKPANATANRSPLRSTRGWEIATGCWRSVAAPASMLLSSPSAGHGCAGSPATIRIICRASRPGARRRRC